MTSSIRSTAVRTLFVLAADDESALQLPLPDALFGFHAHQSCEKLLKALIAAHDEPYPFTHLLPTLLRQLESLGEAIPISPSDVLALQPYGVFFRYHLGAELAENKRQEMRHVVARLREHALERVLQLQNHPTRKAAG